MNNVSVTLKLFRLLSCLLIFCLGLQVLAQTESQYHKKNYDPESNIVHTRGQKADESPVKTYSALEIISSFGGKIHWLFWWTTIVGFIFFLIMAGALAYFIIFNRYDKNKKAFYTLGVSKTEHKVTHFLDLLVFIALDCVVLAASFASTGLPGTTIVQDIAGKDYGFFWNYPDPKKEDVLKLQIMPQQWGWNFRYPGTDDIFGTADDVVTFNELKIPKDKKILVQMKSRDVIHGFWIPNLRMQMDALPGQVTKFWFDSTKEGDFEIVCAHLCGTSHYKMKAFLKVLSPTDFNSWYQENIEWARATYNDDEEKAPEWGWDWGLN